MNCPQIGTRELLDGVDRGIMVQYHKVTSITAHLASTLLFVAVPLIGVYSVGDPFFLAHIVRSFIPKISIIIIVLPGRNVNKPNIGNVLINL